MRETCVGPYLDGVETALTEAGYAHLTVRGYLRAAEHLAWWAGRRRVDIRAWDEDLVQRFRRHHLPHCKCFRDNKGTFGNESYGLKLLWGRSGLGAKEYAQAPPRGRYLRNTIDNERPAGSASLEALLVPARRRIPVPVDRAA